MFRANLENLEKVFEQKLFHERNSSGYRITKSWWKLSDLHNIKEPTENKRKRSENAIDQAASIENDIWTRNFYPKNLRELWYFEGIEWEMKRRVLNIAAYFLPQYNNSVAQKWWISNSRAIFYLSLFSLSSLWIVFTCFVKRKHENRKFHQMLTFLNSL